MNILIRINLFFIANKKQAKEKIIKKISTIIDTFYPKAEIKVISDDVIEFSIETDSWDLSVFYIIRFMEAIGRQWILSGNIEHELNTWTNHSKIIGIESINIIADNDN